MCELKLFFNAFLLNLSKNLNLCTSYVKQITNVFSFVQWNKYFHSVRDEMYHSIFHLSLNRTFHFLPHENICIIALKSIHYLYTNTGSRYSGRVTQKIVMNFLFLNAWKFCKIMLSYPDICLIYSKSCWFLCWFSFSLENKSCIHHACDNMYSWCKMCSWNTKQATEIILLNSQPWRACNFWISVPLPVKVPPHQKMRVSSCYNKVST